MAYERHFDWSPLGLSSDPVPGDPYTVRVAGLDYIDIADAIQDAATKLRKLDEIGDVSKATEELRDKAKSVADNISKAHDRYRATGEALRDYAPKLEHAQDESLAALHDAQNAQADADDAATSKAHYLKLADESDDPDEVLKYTNLAKDGSAASAANAKLTAAKGRLHDATSARDKAADAASDEIKDITDHDGLKDSWWDDWGADLLKIITEVAGWISAIAGILALLVCWIPVIGQALAGILLIIAAVAAVINAVGSLILAATGEMSWTDAIIAVVGAVLSCVGLGGAAKALTGAAKVATVAEEGAAATKTAVSVTSKVSKVGDEALSLDEATKFADDLNALAAKEPRFPGQRFDPVTPEQMQGYSRSEVQAAFDRYGQPLEQPRVGQEINRVSNTGAENGGSWSYQDTRGFTRNELGLPESNNMEQFTRGYINENANLDNIISRHALPLEGTLGGAPELAFRPPDPLPGGGRAPWTLDDKGITVIEIDTYKPLR